MSSEIFINASVGAQTALSPFHGRELVSCIKLDLMVEWGWGYTCEEIKDVVMEFVTKKKLKIPFKEGHLGYDWMQGFLQ